jgi:hypothetical protein
MIDTKEALKQKQQEQLKSEISYSRQVMLNTLAYLDLVNDDRTAKLYGLIDAAYAEACRLYEEEF